MHKIQKVRKKRGGGLTEVKETKEVKRYPTLPIALFVAKELAVAVGTWCRLTSASPVQRVHSQSSGPG